MHPVSSHLISRVPRPGSSASDHASGLDPAEVVSTSCSHLRICYHLDGRLRSVLQYQPRWHARGPLEAVQRGRVNAQHLISRSSTPSTEAGYEAPRAPYSHTASHPTCRFKFTPDKRFARAPSTPRPKRANHTQDTRKTKREEDNASKNNKRSVLPGERGRAPLGVHTFRERPSGLS